MRSLWLALFLMLISPAHAALVKSGDYVYGDSVLTYVSDTESGLDWINLNETYGMSYTDAGTAFADEGWRHATNAEVESFFYELFDGYYDTHSNGISYSTDNEYDDQREDALAFYDLMLFGGYDADFWLGARYKDEDGIIRSISVRYHEYYDYVGDEFHSVEGLESNNVRQDIEVSGSLNRTFLVRFSVVPIPAAVWLFGSALAGLGWMRRKQSV